MEHNQTHATWHAISHSIQDHEYYFVQIFNTAFASPLQSVLFELSMPYVLFLSDMKAIWPQCYYPGVKCGFSPIWTFRYKKKNKQLERALGVKERATQIICWTPSALWSTAVSIVLLGSNRSLSKINDFYDIIDRLSSSNEFGWTKPRVVWFGRISCDSIK